MIRGVRMGFAAVVLAAALLAPVPVSADTSPAQAAGLRVGHSAWVSTAVARLWWSPDAPWAVDSPALQRPVRVRQWLAAMTFDQRRALDVRSPTEALLGDRVVVVQLRPGWAKVVVPSQPSQLDSRGYPGWVPRAQLTPLAPQRTDEVATVLRRTAWLRKDTDDTRVYEVSLGTNLGVVEVLPNVVRVVTPVGVVRRLARGAVAVHLRGQPAIAPSRLGLVRTAKSFLGLQYLWGGLSGFGIDCSGLTWLDYRVHGIRIPRDALPQSRAGRAVRARKPGDLLFYASSGRVHHVTMYVGDGYMIQAPRTGQPVQINAVSSMSSEYYGTRRYFS